MKYIEVVTKIVDAIQVQDNFEKLKRFTHNRVSIGKQNRLFFRLGDNEYRMLRKGEYIVKNPTLHAYYILSKNQFEKNHYSVQDKTELSITIKVEPL